MMVGQFSERAALTAEEEAAIKALPPDDQELVRATLKDYPLLSLEEALKIPNAFGM